MRARVIIGIVIGCVVLYLVAVPNFIRNHRHDPRVVCINNLRLLDAAKEMFAIESKLPPGTVVSQNQLQPFVGRGEEGKFPKCPAGGTYILNPIGTRPACSIKEHVLKD